MNILCIADLSGDTEYFQALFNGNSEYRVLSAISVKDVERAFKEDDIGIIIADTDLLERGDQGLGALLKNNTSLSSTPVIFLAGTGGAEDALQEEYAPDFVDVIVKPVKKSILLSKVALLNRLFCAEKSLSSLENRLESTVEELNEKRVYLDNILQSTKHVAIVAIDLDFKIRYCNRESVRLLGCDSEKDIGKDIFSMFEKDSIPESEFQNAIETLFREGVYRFLYSSEKEKEKMVLDTRVSFMKDRSENRVGFMLVSHDITELKKKEAELNAKAFKLAQSSRELEQLAYIISHDLREPLRTVSGFANILEESCKDTMSESVRSSLGYINSGITHMRDMINALLSYSRVGSENITFESVDCERLLEKVIFGLTSAIKESNADIVIESLPYVYGDEMALHQLFQNLIENSIKFCDKEIPKILIKAEKEDGMWLFSVSDNSIGIDNLFLDRIFKIFQRLHQRGKYSGTGIGLAICKKIVENHSGRIWVESKENEGSVFYFLIPEDRKLDLV